MKYRANPVIVDAFRIERITTTPVNKGSFAPGAEVSMELLLDNGETVKPAWDMLVRIKPVAGDYWVVQSDGYIYLNPKEVFERKYSAITPRKRPTIEELQKILDDPANEKRPIIVNPDGSLTVGE